MNWKLTVLGSSSAIPTSERMLSSQVLETFNSTILFDCGEGTQFQLRKFGIKFFKIEHIFITHLHGDHFYGLFGLLDSLYMLGRVKPLNIFAPIGLKNIISHIIIPNNKIYGFDINYFEIDDSNQELIFENNELIIKSITLNHSVPVVGYKVCQKPLPLNVDKSVLENYNIPIQWINRIKLGEDYINDNGEIIKNSLITKPPKPLKSFAYITDTAYKPDIVQHIENISLLYHEATFSSEDKIEAIKKLHSTSEEAALIALKSNAKQLLIGHFSSRYSNIDKLEEEARKIFNNTIMAYDGLEILF